MLNRQVVAACWTLLALALVAAPAWAQTAKGKLEGFQEVPAIFSPGAGKCSVKQGSGELAVTLDYSGLAGTATQAHIHLGQLGVNGGIMIFICSNLGNGPVGTPACPVSGTVTRTIVPGDVIGGASAQGIAAGDFAAVVAAMKKKTTYCNVHSDLYPGGEIRAQLK
jgi:hypothetical protein